MPTCPGASVERTAWAREMALSARRHDTRYLADFLSLGARAGFGRGVRGGRQPPPRGTAGRPATNVRHIGPYWPLRGPRDQALGPTCAGRPWAVVLGVIVVQIVGFQVGGTSDSWRAVSTAVGTLPLGALLAFGFAAGAASVITGRSTLGARSTRRSTET